MTSYILKTCVEVPVINAHAYNVWVTVTAIAEDGSETIVFDDCWQVFATGEYDPRDGAPIALDGKETIRHWAYKALMSEHHIRTENEHPDYKVLRRGRLSSEEAALQRAGQLAFLIKQEVELSARKQKQK